MKTIPLRPAIGVYFGIGIFLTVIRFLSLLSWAGWHLIYPPGDANGNAVSYLGTCMVGLKGTVVMPIAWPLGIYSWIKGPATLGAIYLYPWFALPR